MTRIIDGTPLALARHIIEYVLNGDGEILDEYESSIRFSLAIFYLNIALIYRYHCALKGSEEKSLSDVDVNWGSVVDDISSLSLGAYKFINRSLDMNTELHAEIQRFDDQFESNKLVFGGDSFPVTEPVFSSKDNYILSIILSGFLRVLSYFSSANYRTKNISASLRNSQSPIVRGIAKCTSIDDIRVLSPFTYKIAKVFFVHLFTCNILSRKKFFQSVFIRQALYPVFVEGRLGLGSHGGQEDSSRWSNANLFSSCAGIPWSKFNTARVPAGESEDNLSPNEVAVILYAHDGYDVRMRSGMESWQLQEYWRDIGGLVEVLSSLNLKVNLCLHPKDSGEWINAEMRSLVTVTEFGNVQNSGFKIATYPSTVLLKRSHKPGEKWVYFFRQEHWPRNWNPSDLKSFKESLYAETLSDLRRVIDQSRPFCDSLHLRFCGIVDQ